MKKILIAVSTVALAAVLAGCGGGDGGGVPNNAVAKVGGEAISRSQFDALLARTEKSWKAQGRPFPKAGTPEYQQLRSSALQYLVQKQELAQKAEELEVKVTDKQINDQLKQIKKQYFGGNEQRYKKQLKAQGVTDAQVRDDLRTNLLSQEIFEKVTSEVKVTDADVKEYYEKHTQLYTQPQSRDVRHILISCSKPADCKKAKTSADGIHSQLADGGNFAALAKQHSQDPGSKNNGGKLTVSKGQTVPEFDKTAFALKTNELSKPVKTQYGYHIIQALSSVKPRKTTPLAQVKEAIRQQLLQQKRNEAMAKWYEDLRKEYCDGKLAYQKGFAPNPDPCVQKSTTGATTTTNQ